MDRSFPVITTKRLRLRQCEARDDRGLHACLGNERLMRYWDFVACEDIDETRRWVRILAKTTSPYDALPGLSPMQTPMNASAWSIITIAKRATIAWRSAISSTQIGMGAD